mgnify:CR=1 FL=1
MLPEAGARLVASASGDCSYLLVHHLHLACLFPQHVPGRKHTRPLGLEPWQEALVAEHPWEALRGAIYTDGSVYENRLTAKGRGYSYTTYSFDNRSEDIQAIVERVARSVGLRPRRNGRALRFARRSDVAALLDRVGRKDGVPLAHLAALWGMPRVGFEPTLSRV